MSSYDLDRVRESMRIRWDATRERRVFERVARASAARQRSFLPVVAIAALGMFLWRSVPAGFASDIGSDARPGGFGGFVGHAAPGGGAMGSGGRAGSGLRAL